MTVVPVTVVPVTVVPVVRPASGLREGLLIAVAGLSWELGFMVATLKRRLREHSRRQNHEYEKPEHHRN